MEPRIDQEAFEENYADFLDRAQRFADREAKGEPFTGFDHPLVDPAESYKKEVHADARAKLLTAFWKQEDVGTGRIHREVAAALKTTVIHRGLRIDNNLLDWRLKDDFVKGGDTRAMEQVLFDLFKGKLRDAELFELLRSMGQQYQFIAYLYFLKDRSRYLPISQQGFDRAFELLGVEDFKTSGNASWGNYLTYIDLIKQLQVLLRERLTTPVDLLDAHSFAWCIGHTFVRWDEGAEDEEDTTPEEASEGDTATSAAAPIPPAETVVQPEFEADLYPEGREKYILHRKAERNPELVRTAKELFLQRDPLMRCEACGFSFCLAYGTAGAGYIEAHHTVPVSTMGAGHESRIEDLAMVCSNCHVMLHRIDPLPGIAQLRGLIASGSMAGATEQS